jgi:dTDP-glucose 4,6-dehydratase
METLEGTILVTGGSGLVGTAVIRQILSKYSDIKVIALVRNMKNAERYLKSELGDSRLTVVEGDVCNPISIEEQVNYIVHTAGVTGGSKQHIDFPMNTINTAIKGTINVLEFAKKNEVKKMVYLSSLEIYGTSNTKHVMYSESDGDYIDPVNVRSSYSESKRMCECICASYAKQYQVNVTIARLCATFGPGVKYTDNRVFAQFARCIIENKDIVLKSTGATIRNYCDTDDCAQALNVLLLRGENGHAYNIANMDTEISIKELAKLFIDLYPETSVSLKFDLAEDAGKLGYNKTMISILNSEKLMNLGWKPQYTLKDTIVRLVEYMKNNREG